MLNSGSKGKRAFDGTGIRSVGEHFNQQTYLIPTVTSFSVTDGSYVPLDDTALDPAGGQTVVLNGTNFAPGATVIVGGTTISVVTFLDTNRLAFTAPAQSSGSYTVFVTNASGGTAILVPGLVYSGFPTFTTAAGSIGSYYETTAINNTINATSDTSITYSLFSGSLPTGASLAANGVISGTAPVDNSSTTYSFTVNATDTENQNTTRAFTLTINTDVVTWSSPADGTVYNLVGNSPMSNVTLSATSAAGYDITYSANTLPTGVTLSGSTISGTPNTSQTVYSSITATSSTTNRSAVRYLNWIISLGDIYIMYNTLLLNTDRNPVAFDSDASNNYIDLVQTGTLRVSPRNPYTEGYYSNYFDGTGDSLSISSSNILNFGTADFTIEFWMYLTSYSSTTPGNIIYGGTNGDFGIYMVNNSVQIGRYNVAADLTYSGAPPLNTWNHWAFTRNNGIASIYLNGTRIASGTVSTSYVAGAFNLGSTTSPAYFSNLRVVKGTAVYTSPFTPPTSALIPVANTALLTCQSNRLIDDGPNGFIITKNGDTTVDHFHPFSNNPTTITVPSATNYSMYFDGTGDSYLIGGNAGPVGTEDFTWECWANISTMGGNYPRLFECDTFVSGSLQIYLSNGTLTVGGNGTGTITSYSISGLTNQWLHLCITRTGSAMRLFVNGVLRGYSASGGTNFASASNWKSSNEGGGIIGSLSNMRVVRGSVVSSYSTSSTTTGTTIFTPPTSPLTAISGTQFLGMQSSTMIDNSTNAYTITITGNPRPIQNGPFISTQNLTLSGNEGSTYFASTSDYLQGMQSAANNTGQIFGTGDFTVECWLWASTTAHNISRPTTLTNTWTLQTYSSQINWLFGSTTLGSGGAIPINAWTHLAVSRISSVTKGFVNGVQVFSVADTNNYSASPARPIGPNGGGSAVFYVSNFRIIKGTGLYRTPFYPSYLPPTVGESSNTALLTCQTKQTSTNSLVIDDSNVKHLVTRNGNASLNTFSPYGSNWSYYFDGVGDYLTIPSSAQHGTLGTSDFTVELWFNTRTTSGTQYLISHRLASVVPYLFWIESGGLKLYASSDNGSWNLANQVALGTISVNQWYHLAYTRSGSSFKVFLNGAVVHTFTSSASLTATTNTLNIGASASDTNSPFNGYISNVRVVKGTAVYTSAFTPPTSALVPVANTSVLTCQSNRLVDNSPNNFTITKVGDVSTQKFGPFSNYTVTPTTYSAAFNGSSYAIIPSSGTIPALGLGAKDFTIECWFYVTNTENNFLLDFRQNGGGSNQTRPILWTNGSSVVYNIGSTQVITATSVVTTNVWYHFAAVRISGSTKLYINGTQVGTAYSGNENFGDLNTLTIGTVGDSPGYATTEFDGCISNLRIVKGLGVYTGNFTAPSTALTVSQNASTNITAIPEIPTNGVSAYFDGTGDYLDIASGAGVQIGSSDFTIEGWFYPTTAANYNELFAFDNVASSGYSAIRCRMNSGGQIELFMSTSGGGWAASGASSGTLTLNSWNHVAVVRNGSGTNNITVYINGQSAGLTLTFSGSGYTTSGLKYSIGAVWSSSSATEFWQGYISNFRMVKGTAVYTTTFTPATSPLTAISNTSLLTCQTNSLIDTSNNLSTITVNGNTVALNSFSPFGYATSYLALNSLNTLCDVSVNRVSSVAVTGTITTTITNPFGTSGHTVGSGSQSWSANTFGSSVFFDGTGDYLSVPANTTFAFDTSDYTLEFWVYSSIAWASTICLYNTNSGGYFLQYATGTGLQTGVAGSSTTGTYAVTLTSNSWIHIAVSRESGSSKCFVNGTQVGSTVSDTTNYAQNGAYIGALYNGTQPLKGHISNLRVVKGTALYTSPFYPPLAPSSSTANTVLALNNTPAISDYSMNNSIETLGQVKTVVSNSPYYDNYSVYFDGTGDYLSSTSLSAIGTGDFTIECWAYITGSLQNNGIFHYASTVFPASNSGLAVAAFNSSGSGWTIYYGNGSQTNGGAAAVNNTWYHLALVRSGTSLKLYVNGTLTISVSDSTNYTGTAIAIGGYYNSTYVITGMISNFRITKSAVYTSTFTPPTSPLTAIENTSLLTCQSNRLIDNSTNNFTITKAGDAAVKPFQPFTSLNTTKKSSIAFDGSGDYLYELSNSNYAFGTGNFTIEFWAYPTVNARQDWLDITDGTNRLLLYYSGSNITYYITPTIAAAITGGVPIFGAWNHIALVRSSGVSTLYLNGVRTGATYNDTKNYGAAQLFIGKDGGGSTHITGNLADIRIGRYARYTANTTPPTSPHSIN